MAIKKIGVISETTVDMPDGMAKKNGVHLLPIDIIINDERRTHGKDVVNQEVVEHLLQKDNVSTEPVTPLKYSLAYKKLLEQYDYVFSMQVSSKLSQCYANARYGIRLLKKKQAKGEASNLDVNNIKIIDTRTASVSQGQIVNRIATIVKNNYDLGKIDQYIAWLIKRASMFFVVDNLYWLKRAGRVNGFSSFFGNLLDIKPIIKLDDGNLIPVQKPKGSDVAIDSMLRMIRETTPKYKRGIEVWVAHSASLLDAKYIRKQVAADLKIKENKIPIIDIGPTIGVHTGPGTVCVSILPR